MKCPKCNFDSKFQVITKEGKKYAQCSKCHALLTSDDLRKKATQTPPPEKPKDKKSKTATGVTGTIIFIIIIIIFVKLFNSSNSDGENKETVKTQKAETSKETTDGSKWTTHDYTEFMTITKSISDEYVANYKAPFFPDNWKFAKFDEEGRIMATTKYSFQNINEKQYVICVFTRGEDFDEDGYADTYTPHFLSIGNNIYINDGSCNEFFQNIQDTMQYFES